MARQMANAQAADSGPAKVCYCSILTSFPSPLNRDLCVTRIFHAFGFKLEPYREEFETKQHFIQEEALMCTPGSIAVRWGWVLIGELTREAATTNH